MKEQLDNQVLSSFCQWFDHTLLKDGEAYQSKTAKLYPQKDNRFKSLYKYASPHKQWVSDSSIPTDIPTGISISGVHTPFNPSSMFPDWDNGRIISTTDLGDDLECTYSVKNFNVYITNDSEEEVIFQNRYEINDLYSLPQSGIPPYSKAIPACFLTFNNTTSKTYALGSADYQEEEFNVRAIVITNNTMDMDACFSVFRKKKNRSLPILSSADSPYNEYGSIKNSMSGVYDYSSFLSDGSRDLLYIDSVSSSKMFAGSHEAFPKGMKVGFINFKLTYFRSP